MGDPSRRLQMMKIVVTNTTAGMVIGKGGATVKGLNESYDVRIQASQKDDLVMGERVVTILGSEKGKGFRFGKRSNCRFIIICVIVDFVLMDRMTKYYPIISTVI